MRATDRARAAVASASLSRAASASSAGAGLEALDLGEPRLGLPGERHHLGETVAVLPAQLTELLAPAPELVESLGIVGHPLVRDPELLRDVVELGLGGADAGLELRKRGSPGQRVDRLAERVEPGAFDRVVGAGQRLAVRRGVREERLLGFEHCLLVLVVDRRGGDLVHLEAEQIDLARTRAFIAAECSKIGRDRTRFCASGAVGGKCRERGFARVPIERASLHRRIEQRLVRVLSVQIHEAGAAFGELTDGREPTIDVRATARVARHDAGEHDLLTGLRIDEAALDARFGRAVAHERRVGASTDEQLQRLDQQCLARAGLAGDRGEPGAQHEIEIGNDAEIHDMQLDEHRVNGRRGRIWPSGSGGSRVGRA